MIIQMTVTSMTRWLQAEFYYSIRSSVGSWFLRAILSLPLLRLRLPAFGYQTTCLGLLVPRGVVGVLSHEKRSVRILIRYDEFTNRGLYATISLSCCQLLVLILLLLLLLSLS